jgi:hypothetical protein
MPVGLRVRRKPQAGLKLAVLLPGVFDGKSRYLPRLGVTRSQQKPAFQFLRNTRDLALAGGTVYQPIMAVVVPTMDSFCPRNAMIPCEKWRLVAISKIASVPACLASRLPCDRRSNSNGRDSGRTSATEQKLEPASPQVERTPVSVQCLRCVGSWRGGLSFAPLRLGTAQTSPKNIVRF